MRRIIPLTILGVLVVIQIPAAPEGVVCESALCRLVAAGSLGSLRWPDFSDDAPRIRAFYEPAGYGLAWTRGGVATSQAKEVIAALESAGDKGLNAEDYDGPRWATRLARFSEDNLVEFDLALTVCSMRYITDLHFGRANPGLFHARGDTKDVLSDLPRFLRDRVVDFADVKSTLDDLEPPYPGYRRTQQALQRYLALANDGVMPVLPVMAKPIEPGADYGATSQLAAILRRYGDLGATVEGADSAGYSAPLVEAVKRFQLRHGLDADGRLGKSTFAQLNVPLSQRILQLQLTLERWRWAPHTFPRPPVVVNIPEFKLRALNPSYQTDLEMKVVVGKAFGHQTPVFSADMKHVVFRPYWDVPYSITRAELVPKTEKDRAYLAKNRYEVVDARGKVVAEQGWTPAQLRSGASRVRQLPGPENALGLIKFLFPNEYNVYLHSTPATELFRKNRRDFSHGCIRVEKPEELAAWVLQDKPDWTPERIHDSMNGDNTFEVTLDKPIPVLIVYATAVVLESGEVRFFDDIYKEDAVLQKAIANRSALRH